MSTRIRKPRPVGLTASAGYQIGVRRTLAISREEAWERLTYADGLKMWLGSMPTPRFHAGEKYESEEGIAREFRVVKLHEQLRLTWQPKSWSKPSTLQIRPICSDKSPYKTTVSFHQEHFSDALVREEMKLRWEQVIARLAEAG